MFSRRQIMRQIMLGSAALMSFALPRPSFAKFGNAPHVASTPVSEAKPPQSIDPDPVTILIRREELLEDLQDRVDPDGAFVTLASDMTQDISFPTACRRMKGELDRGELPSKGSEYARLCRLYNDIKVVTQDFLRARLFIDVNGEAQRVLNERITRETVAALGMGLIPACYQASPPSPLERELLGRGWTRDDLAAGGFMYYLSSKSYSKGWGIPDRLIIPLSDPHGRVIAFLKYRHSSASWDRWEGEMSRIAPALCDRLIFHRFGDLRRRREEPIILVSSIAEAIGLWQAGFHQAVAPAGDEWTSRRVRSVRALARRFVFIASGESWAYDMQRLIHWLGNAAVDLQVAFLPEGTDLREVVNRQGVRALQASLDRSTPASDLLTGVEG